MKYAPSEHKSNFKKVGAIPCGCNKKLHYPVKNIKIFMDVSLSKRDSRLDNWSFLTLFLLPPNEEERRKGE